MLRVNQYRFYALGTILAQLRGINSKTEAIKALEVAIAAREAILGFPDFEEPPQLPLTKPAAGQLLAAVESLYDYLEKNIGSAPKINALRTETLMSSLRKFENVLDAECSALDTYAVSAKGLYCAGALIEKADEALPSEIRSLLPDQVLQDLRAAGRCLAFDLPTACGYHLIRATESVVRDYYGAVTGLTVRKKDRNWGAYVKNLRSHKEANPESRVDLKIVSLIDQIREHHRNALIHPDDSLTNSQALTLFGVCQSAIVVLVNGIEGTS